MKRTNGRQTMRVFGMAAIVLCLWASAATTGALAQNLEVVGQIGGGYRAVQVVGNYAYAGEGPSLVVWDVSNPDAPQVVSRLLLNPLNHVRDIQVTGGLAYIAEEGTTGSLKIVNVSQPSSLTLVGSYTTPDPAVGVFESNGMAYVAAGDLLIIDVSDPSSPTLRSRYPVGGAEDVVASGSLAYVAAGNLVILDVSDPSSPTLRSSTPNGGRAISLADHLAYIAGNGLRILDVSDPSSPTLQGSLPITDAYNLYVTSNTAYLADWGGLSIVDVSNPTSPTLRGSYETRGGGWSVWATSNTAYLASVGYWGGLRCIDVSNPTSPTLRAFIPSPTVSLDVFVAGGIACVGTLPQDLYTIDVNSTIPACLAEIELWAGAGAEHIWVSSSTAYVAGGDRLNIVGISNPSSPTLLFQGLSQADNVVVLGNLAYVAGATTDGLGIFDISNASSPTLVGSCATSGTAIYVSGARLYAADGITVLVNLPTSGDPYFNGTLIAKTLDVIGNQRFLAQPPCCNR